MIAGCGHETGLEGVWPSADGTRCHACWDAAKDPAWWADLPMIPAWLVEE